MKNFGFEKFGKYLSKNMSEKNEKEKVPKKFEENLDYKEILQRLKNEFVQKFADLEPSGKLQDFDIGIVIGQGAFGIVVSFSRDDQIG
jgi:hypothetical protein